MRMNQLRIIRWILYTVLLCTAAPLMAQPTLRLATLAPKGSTFHQELVAMGQTWAKAPGGGVKLTIYTDGSQGGEADMVRRLRGGQLQAALLTVAGLTEIDDSVAALQNMPMMFHDAGEL